MSQTNTANQSKTEPEKQTSVSELSLVKLLSTLTPPQLWSLIGVVFIILSGVFGFGYKLNSIVTDVEISKFKLEITNLKTESNNLRQKLNDLLVINKEMETKERFLTLYIRYIDAKEACNKKPSEQELVVKRKNAANTLSSFLLDELSQSSKKNSKKHIPVMRAGMGRTQGETVIIFNDGTKWALPDEILNFRLTPWLTP